MKRIVFTMMMFALLLHAGEPKYAEEWHGRSRLEINYGHILGDDPFPYHPNQEEYHKALLKGAASSLDVQVVTEDGIPIKDAIAAEAVSKDENPAIQKAEQDKQAADEKESFVATGGKAAAVTATVSDFLLALKNGQKDKAVSAYGQISKEQAAVVEEVMSKAIPFFTSGKVESAVEPIVWISGDVAIIPIRQWQPNRPERIEIELTCLTFRDGKWCLLLDFEHPFDAVNALNEQNKKGFKALMPLFRQYKRERKR